MTRDDILAQGGALGGNTGLGDVMVTSFKAWLTKMAKEWPWSQLKKKAGSDIVAVELASGSATKLFGAGLGDAEETLKVQSIFDPITVYTSDYRTKATARVKTLTGNSADNDELATNPSTNLGLPATFKLARKYGTDGGWVLKPNPIPNRDYLLTFDYLVIPADPGASDTPWYPNDETMIQWAAAFAKKYDEKFDEWQLLEAELRDMITRDKLNFGQNPGDNDRWPLDGSVFR